MFNQIMLALSVEQPMEAVLLPGILDGLSGRLGMTPPGVVDQPTSAQEGISWQWAAALRGAVMTTEGREADPDQITPHVVHLTLHQDYELDSRGGGLMTSLQPLHPLCWRGLPATSVSLGGHRCPRSLNLPRQERACKVTDELLLSQQYQAPHT